MNMDERLKLENEQIFKDWALLNYALFNLKMQAKQDVADIILSTVESTGPRKIPMAGNLKAAGLIKVQINTATLIAVKLGGYTFQQMVSEWKFETGQTFAENEAKRQAKIKVSTT